MDTIDRISPLAERELRRALRRSGISGHEAEMILLSLAQRLQYLGRTLVLTRPEETS